MRALRERIKDRTEYDDYALDAYRALSHYIAAREQGMPAPQAARITCEHFGHDAPRGRCLRCGLGVDLTDTGKERDEKRDRIVQRDRWLKDRMRTDRR
jgi:hypothetical protein